MPLDNELLGAHGLSPLSPAMISLVASGPRAVHAYLDLFNGNPLVGGVSVLSTIAGSTTRTNIASDLQTTSGNIATNPDTLVVSSSIVSAANVSYVGLYSAATGGTLLMSGPLSSAPTLVAGYVLQFNALGLTIDLN